MAHARVLALLPILSVLAASPAAAQFPNIFDTLFGNPPQQQRPPADIPERPSSPVRPGPQYLPPGGLPPGPPPGSRIRTEPLPPPPGATASPPPVRVTPQPGAPAQQASVPPQPPQPTETVVEPPPHKVPNPTAVFSGLDKITGRIINFDVAINETVRFGALEVTPRACFTRPPTEAANTDGFIEVDEVTLQGELKRIFSGWMFAASPGLNAVEHPIYDVWLTDCKGAEKQEVAAQAPATAPAPKPPARPQPQRRPAQQLPPPPAPPAR